MPVRGVMAYFPKGANEVKIAKLKTSDPKSWTLAETGAFYVQNRQSLHARATRILKDSARAEEVVQEAWIRFILAAPELRSTSEVLSYLNKTIENLCIDIFRQEGRRPNLIVLDSALSEIESKFRHEDDVSEVLISADDAAIVRQALSLLSPGERTALVMWEMEGRSTEEIAQALGIKKSAVRHTVSRARTSLRRIFTEFIVDPENGLTALDLLSTTYKKAAKVAKKSSTVALSLALLLFGFFGFNVVRDATTESIVNSDKNNALIETFASVEPEVQTQEPDERSNSSLNSTKPKLSASKESNSFLKFPGLDKSGIPIGFTVSDSEGNIGDAFFIERSTFNSELEIVDGQIVKTKSTSANIFISQAIVAQGDEISYTATVSFGRNGEWIPLVTRVSSTEISRVNGGQYLFTAYLEVQSEVESPITVVASAGGRDLVRAPKQVVTRVLLTERKTQVLSQAVYVVEKDSSV